jgi:hypothetical protein
MAKRNSMSTARQSRNRSRKPAAQAGSTQVGRNDRSGALIEIVSVERTRLMKADAVLQCVAFTLLYEDWLEGPNRPCFADAVAIVQELLDETVERLGSGCSS